MFHRSRQEDIKMAIDPVCKMSVDEQKTKFTSTYAGNKFYFCSANCKATFDKDPKKYAR